MFVILTGILNVCNSFVFYADDSDREANFKDYKRSLLSDAGTDYKKINRVIPHNFHRHPWSNSQQDNY